jgi:hypothetical protein
MKYEFKDKDKDLIVTGETEFEKEWIKKSFTESTIPNYYEIWGAWWRYKSDEDDCVDYDNPVLIFRKIADRKEDLLKK